MIVSWTPIVLSLVAAAMLMRPERSFRRSRRGSDIRQKLPDVPLELVDAWYSNAPLARPGPRVRRDTFLLHLSEVPLTAAALLLILGAMVSTMGSTFQSIKPRSLQAPTVRGWTHSLSELQASGGSAAAIDSVIARSTVASSAAVDSEAFRELAEGKPAWAVDPNVMWSALRSLPAGLSAEQRTLLDTASRFAGVAWFRRAAHSSPPAALWSLRGVGLRRDSIELAGRSSGRITRLALRNVGDAALSLSRNDKAAAVERAHEIVSVGRWLMREPLRPMHERGVSLVEIGARLLSEIGLATHDVELIRESEGLTRAVTADARSAALFERFLLARLSVGSGDSVFARAASDRRLWPVDRWALASAIVSGACWNPAELRSGVAKRRFASLDLVAKNLSDLDRSAEWIAERRAELARLDAGGTRRDADDPFLARMKPLARSVICAGI
jgi:hypothetical protein